MIASKRDIDRAAQSFSLEDRNDEFDFPQTTNNLVREQRIIDISNGIQQQDRDLFSNVSSTQKASTSVKFSNLSNLFATTADTTSVIKPSVGQKLKDMDMMKLPELNTDFPRQYFKRVRKDMFSEIAAHRGTAKVKPKKSVSFVQQNQSGPKSLFITEWDKVRPSDAELAAVAEEEKVKKAEAAAAAKEEGKSKKKDKKKAPPVKTYPHHKYEFAPIGPNKMDTLENCLHASKDSLDSTGPITLSYFTRPEAPTSALPEQTPEEKAAAKELIAAKKAKLLSMFAENPALLPLKVEEGSAPDKEDEKPKESKAKEAKPKDEKKKTKKVKTEKELKRMEEQAEIARLAAAEEAKEYVWDAHGDLIDHIDEFNYVKNEFDQNKLKYEERTLKNAIIYDNMLNSNFDEANRKQEQRYPDVSKTLLHDPFYVPKPKKKGKKKK